MKPINLEVVGEEVVTTKKHKIKPLIKRAKYNQVKSMKRSQLNSTEIVEGETIEQKCRRLVNNGEGIKDGAPEIFTERKDGVMAAFNIRTDRWEIAAEAMDKVAGSIDAKREEKPKTETKTEDGKVIDLKGKDSGAESTQGKES